MHIKLRDNVEENLRQTVVSRRKDIYSPLLVILITRVRKNTYSLYCRKIIVDRTEPAVTVFVKK